MLSVICWKWKAASEYRSLFGPEAVNTLRRMVARHLHREHEFVCITDDPAGIDAGIRIIPLWDWPKIHFHHPKKPNCYRRLRVFAPDAAELIGPEMLSIDLDAVITGDITPLLDGVGDFKIWGDTHPRTPYNGSLWYLRAGARPRVYTEFDPVRSPTKSSALGYVGSDQAWIGACLGPYESKWSAADGVYSYRNELAEGRAPLPANARIVLFHGKYDPWHPACQQLDWVRAHYR